MNLPSSNEVAVGAGPWDATLISYFSHKTPRTSCERMTRLCTVPALALVAYEPLVDFLALRQSLTQTLAKQALHGHLTPRYNRFFALYPIKFTVGRSGHPKTHP